MFDIEFYQNKSEKNRIGKTLEHVVTLSGNLKERTSVVSPVIQIKYNGFINANYAKISAFGRSYFVTDIVAGINNIWEVKMHCDVLESFSTGIKKSLVVLDRQEFDYNLYIPDEKIPLQGNSTVVTKAIGNKYFGLRNVILLSQG